MRRLTRVTLAAAAAAALSGCAAPVATAPATTPYNGALPTTVAAPATPSGHTGTTRPSATPATRTARPAPAAWCPKVAHTFTVGTSGADDVVTAAHAALRVIAHATAETGLPRPIRAYLRDAHASFTVLATGNRYPSAAEMSKIQKPLRDLPAAKAAYATHCRPAR